MAKPWLEAGVDRRFPGTGRPSAARGEDRAGRVPRRGRLPVRAVRQRLFHADGCATTTGDGALPMPRLLWLNTGVLVLSSVALQCAQIAARHGPDGRPSRLACSPAALIRARLPGRPVAGLAAARRRRLFRRRPIRPTLLLPAHRRAWPARARRAGCARAGRSRKLWHGVAIERLRLSVRALRHLLAFPAAGLAGRVRAAGGLGRRLRRSSAAQLLT